MFAIISSYCAETAIRSSFTRLTPQCHVDDVTGVRYARATTGYCRRARACTWRAADADVSLERAKRRRVIARRTR